MQIPKKLYIGGLEFTVVFDSPELDSNLFGEINHHNHKIHLATKTKDGVLTPELIEQTYLHEVVHAVLEVMQERDLNDNEKFVNTFSTFLHQIIQQLK